MLVALISCKTHFMLLISTVNNLSSCFFSCAVRNTPKYKEVKAKGQGKIVSHVWLEKCYALKKYLPWRRFALDPQDQQCPESDDEIMEDSRKPNPNDDVPSCSKNVLERSLLSSEDTQPQLLVGDDSSDPDTEDELERVAQSNYNIIYICKNINMHFYWQ